MRNRCIYATALIALFLAIGCSKNPSETSSTTTTQQPENLNLQDEFGGYTASNEQPAFNDPSLKEAASQEADYDDPVQRESDVDSICNDPQSGWFHFRANWGHLQYDSTSTTPTDWGGSLTISRGALILRKVIRFEPRTDSILPRTDRKMIEWESQTTVFNDGIAVDIVVPRPKPIFDTTIIPVVDSLGNPYDSLVIDTVIDNTPVTLTFTTPLYSRTFTLEELAKLDTIVDLDNGLSVAFAGFHRDKIGCPKGFLAGFWGTDSTGQGIFRGYWMSKFGIIDGFLHGHYGVDSAGKSVFFGKWITTDGQFEGFLRGTYHNIPTMRPYPVVVGLFRGEIFGADSTAIGELKGGYSSGRNNGADGFFAGRWKLNCGHDESDDKDALGGIVITDDGF